MPTLLIFPGIRLPGLVALAVRLPEISDQASRIGHHGGIIAHGASRGHFVGPRRYLAVMNINIWLPPVITAVIGALLSPSVGKGLLALAGARARRIKHVPVDGVELYANGVPMDEHQFRAAFAAYRAELDTLPPPAERNEWQMKQQFAAVQRLAVITGRHPQTFPNIGDPGQAWEWYRDNNPYVTATMPVPPRGLRLRGVLRLVGHWAVAANGERHE